MARADKQAAVAELSRQFSDSAGAVLTEYRGLSVPQLQQLRRALGEDATYAVVKNTLTRLAARDAGVVEFEDLLAGPSAIAFITGDPVQAAKGLRDFARANQPLVIKGGVLDGRPISADEIARMADLESREVLLAKLAGAMLASAQNAAALFNAPLAQLARVLGALQAQLPADTPAETPADTRAEPPADTAAETPADTRAETSAETSAETPAETPADSPAETPADS